MLREGMLRCLEAKPLSKITVSDLCRESGINRATFYNHYSAPVEILKELGREYGSQLMTIYASGYDRDGGDDRRALEAGLTYLAERKQELKVLFSEHAESFLAGVAMEIINERASENARTTDLDDRRDEYLLCAATSASAAFGFIQTWMTMGIERTPAELAGILKSIVQGNVFVA